MTSLLPRTPHADPSPTYLFHPANSALYAESVKAALLTVVNAQAGAHGPATGTSPAQARTSVNQVDLDAPLPGLDAALEEVRRLWLDDAVWFHDPAYAAHLNCPVVIPAVVGEHIVGAVNSSLDTFDQSVGATMIEQRLIRWVADRARLGAHADGVFTSGGSQSNLQALIVARRRTPAAPADRVRVFTSAESHFSIEKSAAIMGMPPEAVIAIPVDAAHRMDTEALADAIRRSAARGEVPLAVVATAGTTDFGAIDPLEDIADVCAAAGTWFHVDAAYGGGLLVSRKRRGLLAGIERADSVTIDFHKTYFQPVSSSALLVRDAAALQAVTWHADYLNPTGSGNPDQVNKSLQTTRRFDALKLWLTLRVMGPDLVGDYLDDAIDLAQAVHAAMAQMDDLEIAAPPHLSTIVFRYRPADPPEDAELDEVNDAIRSELYRSGTAMVAATSVNGRRHLKLTLLNPMASLEDILVIVAHVRRIGQRMTLLRRRSAATGSAHQ